MSFELRWDLKAEEQLDKLPKEISIRIVKKVAQVAETGRGIEALKEFKYGHKIRVGDYRALVDVYYDPDLIVVRVVDHRGKIYKR
ncbi:MAG: type II toxin-antitoxin system RelE/ParE family toxin [DPANN group archaeon]|nr:type II toxin-antitoxin system RelE/ParE family toxin [DPANN group archaeon]